MKIIPTSAVALSLLVATPLAAFADTNVSNTVQASVQTGGPSSSIRANIENLFKTNKGDGVQSNEQVNVEAAGEHASSSDHVRGMNHASTTRPANGLNGTGDKVRSHSDTEIDARITSLNKMLTRLADAARLTSDAKASLLATLNTQIASLTSLKAQIDTEATTTLKTDQESITKDFRIYALVMPKAAITAAADRAMTIVGQMQTLSAKLGTRIASAQTAGADVTAAVSAHTDFDAKVADASVQAQAAVSAVANLSPDAGATTTLQANITVLKDAKAKIDAAQADLKAARADVDVILKAVKGKGEVKATATTTAKQ